MPTLGRGDSGFTNCTPSRRRSDRRDPWACASAQLRGRSAFLRRDHSAKVPVADRNEETIAPDTEDLAGLGSALDRHLRLAIGAVAVVTGCPTTHWAYPPTPRSPATTAQQ